MFDHGDHKMEAAETYNRGDWMDPKVNELRRMLSDGRNVAALRQAMQLLEHELVVPAEAIEIARAGYLAAMALERYYEARLMADEEFRRAQAHADPELVAVASYHLGTALLYMGDLPTALDRLQAFLAADDPPRPDLAYYRGPCWFNAGLALTQQKQYREAVSAFLRARSIFDADSETHNVIRALLEAAWTELLDNRAEPAGFYLEEASGLLENSPDPHLQSVCLVHKALYHFRLGELTAALGLCEEVLMPGRPGVKAHQLSEAAWIAGECALRLGRPPEARAFAALAMDEAINAKWPALMNRTAELQRRIRESEFRSEGA